MHHCQAITVVVLAAASPLLAGTPTSTFEDFTGGMFINHVPHPDTVAPYGPFEFAFGDQTITVTRDPDWPEEPGVDALGSFGGFIAPDPQGWGVVADPAVDPGDYEGRAYTADPGEDIILNMSAPVRAFGATFKHFTASGMAQGDRVILAFDGPDGTGNLIGQVASNSFQYAGFRYYLDFVGVIDENNGIQSVRIIGDGAWTFIDGIAVVPAAAAPCPGDATGDGLVNFDDLNEVLDHWESSVAPGTDGDVTGDGLVNFADLNEVLAEWAAVC